MNRAGLFRARIVSTGSNVILGNIRRHYLERTGPAFLSLDVRKQYSSTSQGSEELAEKDYPELPSEPSWSLKSIMKRRDKFTTSTDKSTHITPATIDQLLRLSHLCKPTDRKELKHLEKDVRRMRNFLNHIVTFDTEHEPIEGLKSLVDDGSGLRLRPTTSLAATEQEGEQELLRRREMLLERPQRVKGNFFVVGAELDPKDDN
ncbi:hypothetical protein BG011_002836 [Mortierella polycephala]|uniref:Uncharacterized protein n=1 Tax=Mortierella polycephala TaxID=41804 RepID=A0A9P6Q4C9_9FUNG|nr:hypothetical protein BG011_002836 [Mortierella polycephala]